MYFTAKCPIPSDISDGKIDYSGLYEDDYVHVFMFFFMYFTAKCPIPSDISDGKIDYSGLYEDVLA